MKKPQILTALAVGIACLGGSALLTPMTAFAQSEPASATTTDVPLGKKDVQFVTDAASAGALEIDSSKLALERSSNPKIKDFAKTMVSDHGGNGAKLKKVATERGATVSTALASNEQKEFDALKAKKSGKEFDDAYCALMLTSHRDAFGRYMGAKVDVTDPILRAYITETLPTLKHHVELAEALNKSKS